MNEQQPEPAPENQQKASVVGKRYLCTKCGFEFIVTRGGGGEIRCCGQPAVPKK